MSAASQPSLRGIADGPSPVPFQLRLARSPTRQLQALHYTSLREPQGETDQDGYFPVVSYNLLYRIGSLSQAMAQKHAKRQFDQPQQEVETLQPIESPNSDHLNHDPGQQDCAKDNRN